jgi:hypothetical protein
VKIDAHIDTDLPSVHEIFARAIPTREFVGDVLRLLVQRESLKCVARAVHFNRKDAWSHEWSEADFEAKQQSRTAWLELLMLSYSMHAGSSWWAG